MSEDEPQETKLTAEYLEVKTETAWQGKTGGYLRNESAVLKILDCQGQEVTAIWEKDWTESAPGIETRHDGATVVHLLGRTKYETRVDRCVRIQRKACPVAIQFVETNEYVDYDDSQYSSRTSRVYWVRYVV